MTDDGRVTAVVVNPHVVEDFKEEVSFLKARLRERLGAEEFAAVQEELAQLYPQESAAEPRAMGSADARAAVLGRGSAA